MNRLAASLAVAAAVTLGALTTGAKPAEAGRSGGLAAGLIVGAVVGAVIANEIRRDRRRTYYYSTYRRPVRYYYY